MKYASRPDESFVLLKLYFSILDFAQTSQRPPALVQILISTHISLEKDLESSVYHASFGLSKMAAPYSFEKVDV